MSFIGNLIWFLLGGFILGLGWIIAGILWCITIIGIPLGIQCFKIAGVALFPFGKQHFKLAQVALLPFGTYTF